MTPVDISIGASPYNWWDLVPAVVGGIIGALAGGIPAYLLAVRSSKEALRKEQDIESVRQSERAFSIFLIFSEALADARDQFDQMEDYIEGSDRIIGDQYPLQRCIRPTANLDFIQYFRIPSSDITVLIHNGEVEFAQRISHSLRKYNSIINLLRTYKSIKEKQYQLLSDAKRTEISETGLAKSTVSRELYEKAQILEAQLESIIVPTRVMLHEVLCDMLGQAKNLGPKLKECVGEDGKALSFQDSDLLELEKSLKGFRADISH